MYNLSLLIDFNKRPSQRKKAYSDSFNNNVLGFEEKKEIICFIEAIQEEGNKNVGLTKHELKSLWWWNQNRFLKQSSYLLVLIKQDPQESQIKETDKLNNLATIYLFLF